MLLNKIAIMQTRMKYKKLKRQLKKMERRLAVREKVALASLEYAEKQLAKMEK